MFEPLVVLAGADDGLRDGVGVSGPGLQFACTQDVAEDVVIDDGEQVELGHGAQWRGGDRSQGLPEVVDRLTRYPLMPTSLSGFRITSMAASRPGVDSRRDHAEHVAEVAASSLFSLTS